MAKQVQYWESADGVPFKTEAEATARDDMKDVLGALDATDKDWNKRQPIDVVKYLMNLYDFKAAKKP